jgi:hypothetical protein
VYLEDRLMADVLLNRVSASGKSLADVASAEVSTVSCKRSSVLH